MRAMAGGHMTSCSGSSQPRTHRSSGVPLPSLYSTSFTSSRPSRTLCELCLEGDHKSGVCPFPGNFRCFVSVSGEAGTVRTIVSSVASASFSSRVRVQPQAALQIARFASGGISVALGVKDILRALTDTLA